MNTIGKYAYAANDVFLRQFFEREVEEQKARDAADREREREDDEGSDDQYLEDHPDSVSSHDGEHHFVSQSPDERPGREAFLQIAEKASRNRSHPY